MSDPLSSNPPSLQSSLRPVTEDDLSRISELEKIQKSPWNAEHFRKEMESSHSRFLVMTDDETDELILGYIVYWLRPGGDPEVRIQNLFVPLSYRGLGIGKKLVRAAVDDAMRNSCERVHLEVRIKNDSAVQLYQGLGFVILGIQKGFYSDGEDAYRMGLELDDSGQSQTV